MAYASWLKTASIATNGTISNAVYLAGNTLLAISMPSTWTTASITFRASTDGNTYQDVYNGYGAELSITASKDVYISLNQNDWIGVNYIQIRSGSAASPVSQTPSGVTFTLVTKKIAQ